MRRLHQLKAWSGGMVGVGSPKVVATPCPLARSRLRVATGRGRNPSLRVRAVVEEPHGAAGGGGPSSGGGGGGSSRPARPSSIRWARRQRMLASEPRLGSGEDDLLELNVGGVLMQTTRSTLRHVPGSRLAAMFRKGGEGELAHDSAGRLWLDWDPGLFQLVLRYLREAKMSGGSSRRDCLPAVQPADEAPFRRLLSYLGLLPYAGAVIPIALGGDEMLPPPPAPLRPAAAVAAAAGAPPAPAAAPDSFQQPQLQRRQQQDGSMQQPTCSGTSSASGDLTWSRSASPTSATAAAGGHRRAEGEAVVGGPGTSAARGGGRWQRRSGGASGNGEPMPMTAASESDDVADTADGAGPGGRHNPAPGVAKQQQHRRQPHPPQRHQQHNRQGVMHGHHQQQLNQQGSQRRQQLPEPQLESEDFIPGTATCSILTSLRNTKTGTSTSSNSNCTSPHQQKQLGRQQPGDDVRRPMGRPAPPPPPEAANGSSAAAEGTRLPPPRRGGGPHRTITQLSPPPVRAVAAGVSQLFYISTDYSEARGLRVSVHTEDDVRAAAAAAAASAPSSSSPSASPRSSSSLSESFDIFLDTTYSEGQLSLTFVSRRELLPGGVFLGLTSRAQLDRKGAQIPCYGWKSNGCTYNDHTGGGRLGGAMGHHPDAFGRTAPPGSAPAAAAAAAQADGGVARSPEYFGGPGEDALGPVEQQQQPLWRKGDSVELILRQGQQYNQLLLKVNGQAIDVINRLPSFRHWSWYVGLWAGGDISCAVFQRDQYAVYWGDYAVKRYL